MNITTLSAPELVVLAESKGFSREIVGMTAEQVRDFLNENEKAEEVTKDEETKTGDVLSWSDLKKLAKAKGINTYKKKRVEIELLLKGEPHEEVLNDNGTAKMPEIGPPTGIMVDKYGRTPNENIKSNAEEIEKLTKIVRTQRVTIQETNQRIDRIVDAISKSKKVKGL